MKLKPDDILIVQYGDRELRARPARNGGYCSNPECVKVIFENDLYPKTIKKTDIICVCGHGRHTAGRRPK